MKRRRLSRAVACGLAVLSGVVVLTGPPSAHAAIDDITVLAIDPVTPTTLYAGTGRNGVSKSTNGGRTWSGTGLRTNLSYDPVRVLTIDPNTPSTLYAGLHDGGVFKSTDGGCTWSAANIGLVAAANGDLRVYAFAIDPVMSSTLYTSINGRVFKTTDAGDNWNATDAGLDAFRGPGLGTLALVVDPTTPDTVYAGTDGPGVFKSTDGGVSWNAASIGLPVSHSEGGEFTAARIDTLVTDPITPSTLYAVASEGVFKSTDTGASWKSAGATRHNVISLAIDSDTPDTVYAVGVALPSFRTELYKSTDAGDTWSKPTGPGVSFVQALAIDPKTSGTLYAGTNGDFDGTRFPDAGDGVFKSTDGGGNWTAVNRGLPGTTVSACVGDCDSNDRVTINELVLGVTLVLGAEPVRCSCPALANSEGLVDIAQLVRGVQNALEGCGG